MSQPILAQASDGFHYVVKFNNDSRWPNLAFNESAGTELYRACGLAVPHWEPLLVTDSFLDANVNCWMQSEWGSVRPAPGLCFGSRFLGVEGARLLEVLGGTSFQRVRNRSSFWMAWLIDVCAEHVDNRQALFLEEADGWLNAFFVDQGHFFGGPKADQQCDFRASRYLDARIYGRVTSEQMAHFLGVARSLDADKIWKRAQALPDEWKTESGLRSFANCLSKLSNSDLLLNIADTLVDTIDRSSTRERIQMFGDRTTPVAILRPGIQATGRGPRRESSSYNSRAFGLGSGK